jgi:hypothetical protein
MANSDKDLVSKESPRKNPNNKSIDRNEVALEQLSSELTKSSPDLQLIKKLTTQLSIPFSEDLVSQIDFVLKAVNISMRDKIKNRELEG